MGPPARPACSPSPTLGSPTTPALTGSMGARLPAPPGAPPRSTPLVSMSTTRATMGSAPLTPHAPPPCHPRPASGGPGQELSTLAAPHHPSRVSMTSWASKEAFPIIRHFMRLVLCNYSLKENIYLV